MKLPPISIAPVDKDEVVPLRSTPIAVCMEGHDQ